MYALDNCKHVNCRIKHCGITISEDDFPKRLHEFEFESTINCIEFLEDLERLNSNPRRYQHNRIQYFQVKTINNKESQRKYS